MDGIKSHGRIIPTNFGLKYNPPKLGIQYYFKENPKATFVHEVDMENATEKKPDELINDLFSKHKKFVDPKVVSRNQLEGLMERLKSHLSKDSHNQENIDESNKRAEEIETEVSDLKKPSNRAANGLEIDVPENKETDIMDHRGFEKDIFSGAHKDDGNDDKEFMLEDFNMSDEDHKISNTDGILDRLAEPKPTHPTDLAPPAPGATDFTAEPTNLDNNEEEDDSDAIDIDNEEELAARGLKKIQIEGEDEEFLMDADGNIYNLNGDFIGTTNGDADGEGEEDDL